MRKLNRGSNVITITSSDLLEEIAKTSVPVYDSEGAFRFDTTAGTIYVDSIIGVYPQGSVPDE